MVDRDNIIRMAREAGFEVHDRKQQARVGMDALLGIDSTEKLERFAELVKADAVAAEREACAMACENVPLRKDYRGMQQFAWEAGTADCADAIRARGQHG